MQSRLNFYDFVGYVIPGAVLFSLLYWLCVGFFALKLPFEIKSVGESFLFLAGSYFLGHLVHALGNVIETGQVKKWGGWFSEQLLRDDNDYYSSEFKAKLMKCIRQQFGLALEIASDNEGPKRKKRQEAFDLCYSLIVQENAALHTEIFNGIYSLYRGMLAAAWIGTVVSGIIALKHLILWILCTSYVTLPRSFFLHFDAFHLGLGIAFLIFFRASICPLEFRLRRFARTFVNSVYRSFFVWYTRKH